MKDSYEVIVVGAGPAGVAAALICRKRGYNVLLLDKKKREKIGDKVCGEAISKKTVLKAMEKLSIAPPLEEEIKAKIEDLVLRTALPKNHITFPAIGYMIDRHMFGQRLLQEAIKSGVILKDQYRVKKPIVIDNKVSGVLIKDSEHNSIEILSKMVIDCSGTMAVVRTGLPQEYEPNLNKKVTKADFAPCYREIIQLNHDHDLEGKIVLQYEIDIPEPGYIWFFDEGEKRLNCGTGFIKQGKHATKSVKSVYFNALEKYFPKGTYKTIDGRGDVVPIRAP
ncbi:MAG: FAD-dependent oxidoreductase, partial [Candidatus Heimdallarchaeota archaeon]